MKRKLIMNLRTIYLGIAAVGITFLSSCLKDNGPVQDFSKSPALVGFQYTGNNAITFGQSLLPQAGDTVKLEVTLSAASLTLGHNVDVTVAPDDATLAAYNANTNRPDTPTVYSQLPADTYTIQNGGKVTIAAGQQIVPLIIVFDGSKIDFSSPVALALKMTSATGATIATNLNTAIYLLKLRNIYEGHYDMTGQRIGYAGATAGSGVSFTVPLSGNYLLPTVTLTSVTAPLADLGGLTILVTINPATNICTISEDPSNPSFSSLANDGAPSTYDPVNHVFDLHYMYLNGAGHLRHIDEKLTLTGP
ncbi:MAG: hypothetical protein C5B59_14870 [Bacteroidetes bacterium]|nr:MAG: hypothetical protein C5B59_14870 [Bacteroidota bacterium]